MAVTRRMCRELTDFSLGGALRDLTPWRWLGRDPTGGVRAGQQRRREGVSSSFSALSPHLVRLIVASWAVRAMTPRGRGSGGARAATRCQDRGDALCPSTPRRPDLPPRRGGEDPQTSGQPPALTDRPGCLGPFVDHPPRSARNLGPMVDDAAARPGSTIAHRRRAVPGGKWGRSAASPSPPEAVRTSPTDPLFLWRRGPEPA